MTTQSWVQLLPVPDAATDAELAELRGHALQLWHLSIPPGWASQGLPEAELKVAHQGLPNTWTDPETGQTLPLPDRLWMVSGVLVSVPLRGVVEAPPYLADPDPEL